MREFKVKIKGIAPILFNRMTEKAKDTLRGGTKKAGKTVDSDLLKDAEGKIWKNDHGLYIPKEWIKGALKGNAFQRGAAQIFGSDIQSKKGSMYRSFVTSCVFIVPDEIPLNKKTHDGMDERVITTKSGGSQLSLRPFVKDWEVSFVMQVADDTYDEGVIRALLEVAGMRVGLGSGRPDFGRFIVEEFKLMK